VERNQEENTSLNQKENIKEDKNDFFVCKKFLTALLTKKIVREFI